MHAAFLQAILENPDDDTPRLVYADWLDEQGDENRAAFIRLEIAKAATGLKTCPHTHPDARFGCGTCDFCQLEIACERYHEDPVLWGGIGPSLLVGYAHTSRDSSLFDVSAWPSLHTRRGFVADLTLSCAEFLKYAGALFAVAPVVERVTLSDRRPWRAPFGQWTWATYSTRDDGEALSVLPDAFADHFGEENENGGEWGRWWSWDTEAEAVAALSAVCCRFGRAAAKGG